MPDRLTTVEQTTLALDTARTPQVVGTVAIFEPGSSDMTYDRLVKLIRDRIRYVPRYRQRILGVPGRLADPVWVDDSDFDLTFHVRRALLPRPGTFQQLEEFTARVLSRQLDRSRPLWELHLVAGLEHGRYALVAKTHPGVVNGVDTVDLLQVLLDNEPDDSIGPEETWHPIPAPGPVELIAAAVTESMRDPARTVTNLQHALSDVFADLAADTATGSSSADPAPLSGKLSQDRRWDAVTVDLDDLRHVAEAHDHRVHDVALAMITGGLRRWLMTRGENVGPTASLTALTPVSVTDDDDQTSLGSTVEPRLATLPIGQGEASTRMDHIATETQAHKDSRRSIPARELSGIAGFAPTTLHDLGVRSTAGPIRRRYDLVITNAPGPQTPVYLGQTPMIACYPVLPLSSGHLLAIGITSYNGAILIGLNADRSAFGDLDVLAQCIRDEFDELNTGGSASGRGKRELRRARRELARRAAGPSHGAPSGRRGSRLGQHAGSALHRRAAAVRAERTRLRYANDTSMREDHPDNPAQEGDR